MKISNFTILSENILDVNILHLQECAATDWVVHKRLCKEKARERRLRKSKPASEVD